MVWFRERPGIQFWQQWPEFLHLPFLALYPRGMIKMSGWNNTTSFSITLNSWPPVTCEKLHYLVMALCRRDPELKSWLFWLEYVYLLFLLALDAEIRNDKKRSGEMAGLWEGVACACPLSRSSYACFRRLFPSDGKKSVISFNRLFD